MNAITTKSIRTIIICVTLYPSSSAVARLEKIWRYLRIVIIHCREIGPPVRDFGARNIILLPFISTMANSVFFLKHYRAVLCSLLVLNFVFHLCLQGDSGGPMHIANNTAYHIVGEYKLFIEIG